MPHGDAAHGDAAPESPNTHAARLSARRMLPHTLVLDHVSPATRLLEKRRQMFEVQEALEAQKQEFNRKVRPCISSSLC